MYLTKLRLLQGSSRIALCALVLPLDEENCRFQFANEPPEFGDMRAAKYMLDRWRLVVWVSAAKESASPALHGTGTYLCFVKLEDDRRVRPLHMRVPAVFLTGSIAPHLSARLLPDGMVSISSSELRDPIAFHHERFLMGARLDRLHGEELNLAPLMCGQGEVSESVSRPRAFPNLPPKKLGPSGSQVGSRNRIPMKGVGRRRF